MSSIPSLSSPPAPPATIAAPAVGVDPRARNLAIALWATALIVLIGVFTRSWFTPERGDGGLGLTGVEACFRGQCRTAGWGELRHAPKDINVFAWLGMLGGVATAGFAAVIGGLLISGRARQIPIKAFTIVLGLTAFATTMFAMRVFGEMSKDVALGWSGFLAIGGLLGLGGIVQRGVTPLTRT